MTHTNPGFISIIRRETKTYKKRLQRCRRKMGVENVHKLRIGIRRLLALIALFQHLAPQTGLHKLQRRLKRQLDDLDELRDIQVMQETLANEMPALVELEPFLQYLQARQQSVLTQVAKRIAASARRKIHRKINQAGQSVQSALAGSDFEAGLIAGIDALYQTVLQRYQRVDPASASSIHNLRIALKKLRYTLLLTQALIPPLPEQYIQRLQAHLSCMGEIQNSTVLQACIQDFFQGKPPSQVRQSLQNRHQQLMETYMGQRTEVLQFWRRHDHRSFNN